MRAHLAPTLSLCLTVPLALAQDTANEKTPPGRLVDAPGADLTRAFCTYCHSEQIITQQGLSREGWAELLIWMTEEQAMPGMPADTEQQILDYLAEHYGEDRPNYKKKP